MMNGEYAHRMIDFINKNQLTDTALCIAGTLDGGIYFPMAMYAQMFADLSDAYPVMMNKVTRKPRVTIDGLDA